MTTREQRRDPTTGRWTCIATERVERPVHLEPRRTPPVPAEQCPFCPGREHATGPALDVLERDGAWAVRAVANKYPAVAPEGALGRREEGPYERRGGFGIHEVIVESADHDTPLYAQAPRVMRDALAMARRRLRARASEAGLAWLGWFRNHGEECGASQAHPHAQLIGLPGVPALERAMLRRAAEHHARHGTDLLGHLLAHDRSRGDRVVWEHDAVVALCPWAPRSPFEVWLVPTASGAHYAAASDAQVEAAAEGLRRVLAAIARELEHPPHHVLLHTAPVGADAPGYRWHLRVRPRLEPGGGFETGFDGAIVSVPPEQAARVLRDAL